LNYLSFFKPEFFWALFVLGAIILIHFLKRPRTRNLKFSTLRFFQSQAMKSFKARRLRSILQLIVRCALAALIIALFARPFDKNNPLSMINDPQASIFVWIDPTHSMEMRTAEKSSGEIAAEVADSLRRRLPVTSKFYLYDHAVKEFLPSVDETVRFSSRHGDPDPASAIRKLKTDGAERKVLLLLSDFQGNTGAVFDSILKDLPDDIMAVCVPVLQNKLWNYSISDARQIPGQNAVSVKVYARGKALQGGKIYAVIDNMRTARIEVSLAEDDSTEVRIPLGSSSRLNGGEVILETPDPLSFDNRTFFAPGQSSSSRVLIVGDWNENQVIAAALKVSGGSMWDEIIMKNELELIYDDLDSADLVIINSFKRPSRALDAFAVSHTRIKAVIISLAVQEEIQNWSSVLLSKVFASASGKLSSFRPDTPVPMVLTDTISELWRGFPSIKSEEVAVYGFCKGIPGDVLLRFGGGTPAVSALTDKAGRKWVISATPLGITNENNLCETGFFVPFIDRLARYAVSGFLDNKQVWIAGDAVRNPFYGEGTSALIINSDGERKNILQNQPFIKIDKPGIYKMVPSGKPSWNFAVNADPHESQIISSLSNQDNEKVLIVKKDHLLSSADSSLGFWYLPWALLCLLLLAEILLWTGKESGVAKRSSE